MTDPIAARMLEPGDLMLTPEEVAGMLRTSVGTLSQHRFHGTGLPYVKTATGKVLYSSADVLAMLNSGRGGFTPENVFDALESFPGLAGKSEALRKHVRDFIRARAEGRA